MLSYLMGVKSGESCHMFFDIDRKFIIKVETIIIREIRLNHIW